MTKLTLIASILAACSSAPTVVLPRPANLVCATLESEKGVCKPIREGVDDYAKWYPTGGGEKLCRSVSDLKTFAGGQPIACATLVLSPDEIKYRDDQAAKQKLEADAKAKVEAETRARAEASKAP